MIRDVYFLSDGTGITSETLGNTLLTQFTGEFVRHRIPFIETAENARRVVDQINQASSGGLRPILFSTALSEEVREVLATANGLLIDLFEQNLGQLELELEQPAARHTGRAHGIADAEKYRNRISAVEFAIEHDDGQSLRAMALADVILVAPSRCGKTPTSMYLALHHGVRAANYPLLDEDLMGQQLPDSLAHLRGRLFGLITNPNRLHQIRQERRPDSRYASLQQCRFEVQAAQRLFDSLKINYLDTSTRSIEEIAAVIMSQLDLAID
jgi:regulator of PEP synthase PpsR (kinase-PPPase family)